MWIQFAKLSQRTKRRTEHTLEMKLHRTKNSKNRKKRGGSKRATGIQTSRVQTSIVPMSPRQSIQNIMQIVIIAIAAKEVTCNRLAPDVVVVDVVVVVVVASVGPTASTWTSRGEGADDPLHAAVSQTTWASVMVEFDHRTIAVSGVIEKGPANRNGGCRNGTANLSDAMLLGCRVPLTT
uniref:Uncharacterized protein n=1 Tax=Lankesteria abbotti TaxID=340204 RepID=A0A7S2QRF6_9APIC|mmetsp:Transcript_496/g.526  ORF Transcript_496/g.526 Transcript_496/m.526 type:complete len:180 (+) Transcript_496:126-665(+)